MVKHAMTFARRLITGDRQAIYRLKLALKRIDLGWNSPQDLGLDEARANPHSTSGGPDLDIVLQSIQISASDRALDLGCGKGGAIITMARYPFASVDGVELSSDLVRIATCNLTRLGLTNSSLFCQDAALFADLDPYNFLYAFNPFPDIVMRSVMANLALSLRRQPRSIRFLYRNPTCDHLIVNSGFQRIRTFDHGPIPFMLYISDAPQRVDVCASSGADR